MAKNKKNAPDFEVDYDAFNQYLDSQNTQDSIDAPNVKSDSTGIADGALDLSRKFIGGGVRAVSDMTDGIGADGIATKGRSLADSFNAIRDKRYLEEDEKTARKNAEAAQNGVLSGTAQGIKSAVVDNPLDTTTDSFSQLTPKVIGSVAGGAIGSFFGPVGTGVGATIGGIGADYFAGVGRMQNSTREEVEKEALKAGKTEQQAKTEAQKAASFIDGNTTQQVLSGVLQAGANTIGAGKVVDDAVRGGIANTGISTAKDVGKVIGAETLTEAGQSFQESVGTNIGVRQAGFDRDIVTDQTLIDTGVGAATGGLLGGAVGGTSAAISRYKNPSDTKNTPQNEENVSNDTQQENTILLDEQGNPLTQKEGNAYSVKENGVLQLGYSQQPFVADAEGNVSTVANYNDFNSEKESIRQRAEQEAIQRANNARQALNPDSVLLIGYEPPAPEPFIADAQGNVSVNADFEQFNAERQAYLQRLEEEALQRSENARKALTPESKLLLGYEAPVPQPFIADAQGNVSVNPDFEKFNKARQERIAQLEQEAIQRAENANTALRQAIGDGTPRLTYGPTPTQPFIADQNGNVVPNSNPDRFIQEKINLERQRIAQTDAINVSNGRPSQYQIASRLSQRALAPQVAQQTALTMTASTGRLYEVTADPQNPELSRVVDTGRQIDYPNSRKVQLQGKEVTVIDVNTAEIQTATGGKKVITKGRNKIVSNALVDGVNSQSTRAPVTTINTPTQVQSIAPVEGVQNNKPKARRRNSEEQAFSPEKQQAIDYVSQPGNFMTDLPKDYSSDRDVVLAAVKTDGGQLYNASNEFLSDKEIVLEAIKNYPRSIDIADPNIINQIIGVTRQGGKYRYYSDVEALQYIIDREKYVKSEKAALQQALNVSPEVDAQPAPKPVKRRLSESDNTQSKPDQTNAKAGVIQSLKDILNRVAKGLGDALLSLPNVEVLTLAEARAKYGEVSDKVQAFVEGDNKIVFISEKLAKLSDAQKVGLVAHEIAVHAAQMQRGKKEFKQLLANFENIAKANPEGAAAKAMQRVPEDTPEEYRSEEGLAYFLESNPESIFARSYIADFKRYFKEFIASISKEGSALNNWANTLTEAELLALGRATLIEYAQSGGNPSKQSKNMVWDLIDVEMVVDGKVEKFQISQSVYKDAEKQSVIRRESGSPNQGLKRRFINLPNSQQSQAEKQAKEEKEKLEKEVEQKPERKDGGTRRLSVTSVSEEFDKYGFQKTKVKPKKIKEDTANIEIGEWDLSSEDQNVTSIQDLVNQLNSAIDKANLENKTPNAKESVAKSTTKRLSVEDLKERVRDHMATEGAKQSDSLLKKVLKSINSIVSDKDVDEPFSNGFANSIKDLSSTDKMINNLASETLPIRRLAISIKAFLGRNLKDAEDIATLTEAATVKANTTIERFANKYYKPLLEKLSKSQYKLDDLDEFIIALHAPERNNVLYKINEAMGDDPKRSQLSGVSNEMAKRSLNSFLKTPLSEQALKQVGHAKLIDMLEKQNHPLMQMMKDLQVVTNKTMQMRKLYGLLTEEEADAISQKYKYYVPLIKEGYKGKGAHMRRSMGNADLKIMSPTAHIFTHGADTIMQGEQNIAKQSLFMIYLALKEKGDNSLMRIIAAENMMAADANNTGEMVKVPVIRTINKKTGQVEVKPDYMMRKRENVVSVFIAGKEYFIVMNDSNPLVKLAAQQLSGKGRVNKEPFNETFYNTMGATSRWFSSMITQRNPFFAMAIAQMDWFTVMIQAPKFGFNAGDIAQISAAAITNLPSLFKHVYRKTKGDTTSEEYKTSIYEQAEFDGILTGYSSIFKNAETIRQSFGQDGVEGFKQKVLNIKGLGDFLKFYAFATDVLSGTIESSFRMAAYQQALKKNMTRQQAAKIGREINVNFAEKGKMTEGARNYFAFFNASTAGNLQLVRTLYEETPDGFKLSNYGKGIITTGIALGALQVLLISMSGLSEDEIKDNMKEGYYFIPYAALGVDGSKEGLKFRMPWGYNLFEVMGRSITDNMVNDKPVEDTLFNTWSAAVTAFNPAGGETPGQVLAPTGMDWIFALWENKDAFGRDIARKDFDPARPTPGWTRAKESTPDTYIWLAKAIDEATGGEYGVPGRVSPAPEQIKYIFDYFFGGVAREGANIVDYVSKDSEDRETARMPLIGKFTFDTDSKSSQGGIFYERSQKMKTHDSKLDAMRKNGAPPGAIQKYREDNPEAGLIGFYNMKKKNLDALNKRKRIARENGLDESLIKQIDDLIEKNQREFNARWEQIRKEKR